MELELEILAKIEEQEKFSEKNATCYLCQTDLATYIRNLPNDFNEYTIQRNIEQNPYLDKLIDTVLNQQHIPPIVLVADSKDLTIKGEGKQLDISDFKILDGLQRTFRLKEISNAINFFYEEISQNPELLTLTRHEISKIYRNKNVSTYLLYKVIDFYIKQKQKIIVSGYQSYEFSQVNIQELKTNISEEIATKLGSLVGKIFTSQSELEIILKEKLTEAEFKIHQEKLLKSLQIIDFKSYLSNNTQWIEVWINLSFSAQIDKMLILNAGHRQVSVKHQLELLFLNLIKQLDEILLNNHLEIVREKECSVMQFIHIRKSGQFHFSHLISGLLSFIEANPVTITSGKFNILQDKQDDYLSKMNFELLSNYMKSLSYLNEYVNRHDADSKWLAKEVVINGFYGALGDYQRINGLNVVETFAKFAYILESKNNDLLNISGYYEATKNLNTSGNIGKLYRDAIFNAMKELLIEKKKIEWNKHFSK